MDLREGQAVREGPLPGRRALRDQGGSEPGPRLTSASPTWVLDILPDRRSRLVSPQPPLPPRPASPGAQTPPTCAREGQKPPSQRTPALRSVGPVLTRGLDVRCPLERDPGTKRASSANHFHFPNA